MGQSQYLSSNKKHGFHAGILPLILPVQPHQLYTMNHEGAILGSRTHLGTAAAYYAKIVQVWDCSHEQQTADITSRDLVALRTTVIGLKPDIKCR